MALRKTLEMLKRGEEINDALYRLTARDRRALHRVHRAATPMSARRHRVLTHPLTAHRTLAPDPA